MSGLYDDPFQNATRDGSGQVVLAGRYRIVRELGQGAMGVVYLAEDTVLENLPVAIKLPPPVLAKNKRALADLKREALLARRLTHPNIVTLRTLEETPEGVFLVMDYVDGVSLEDMLAEQPRLAEGDVQALFSPLAHALDYAHSQGVLHRDLKPSNIMIGRDGTPLLADFGIARELKESVTRLTGRTISGTLPVHVPGATPGTDAGEAARRLRPGGHDVRVRERPRAVLPRGSRVPDHVGRARGASLHADALHPLDPSGPGEGARQPTAQVAPLSSIPR